MCTWRRKALLCRVERPPAQTARGPVRHAYASQRPGRYFADVVLRGGASNGERPIGPVKWRPAWAAYPVKSRI